MLVDMDEVASATFSFTGTAASTHTLTPDNNSHLLISVVIVITMSIICRKYVS